eukprot:jgi/Botrbrau1/6646/Bobra.104_2s0033.1
MVPYRELLDIKGYGSVHSKQTWKSGQRKTGGTWAGDLDKLELSMRVTRTLGVSWGTWPHRSFRKVLLPPRRWRTLGVVARTGADVERLFTKLQPTWNLFKLPDVEFKDCPRDGYGLVANKDISPGMIFRVPINATIRAKHYGSISLPWETEGPMLSSVEKKIFPADVLLSFAVMDSLQGYGPQEWTDYFQFAVPPLEDDCHPLLFSDELLEQLGDADCVDEVRKEKNIFIHFFPEMFKTANSSEPPLLLRAFAYVGSCYFSTGEQFSLVPFMDFLGHQYRANSSYKFSSSYWELTTAKGLLLGEQATVDWVGNNLGFLDSESYTNERLFQQYGFVRIGNPDDLLKLPMTEIPLDILEDVSNRQLQAVSEVDIPYLIAAKNSLMKSTEETLSPDKTVTHSELLQVCQTKLKGIPSSLEEDLRRLAQPESMSKREEAILRYRVERRRLIQAVLNILEKM